jgi:DNA primase
VVATCGTALTEAHAQNLRRRTREVVLLFDGDEAGQKAMERSLDVLLPAGLRVRAALLPQGDDPDSLLARDGDAALRERVEAAPPALEVSIRRAVARGCATPAEKADAVASVAAQLLKVESPVERGAYEERLALAVGANVEDVRAAVRAQRRGEDALEEIRVQPRVEPAEVRKLRQLARSLVEHPHLAPRVDRERLSGIEDHPVVELIRQLVAAAGEDRRVDLEELSARLSEPARQLLYALVAEDHVPEPEAAEKLVVDTNRWLERRELRAAQAALTERLRSGAADPLAILRAKQARGGAGAHSPPREKTH